MKKLFILSQSSVFGLGYMPWAPGTWGTLGALPLWWALSKSSLPVWLLSLVVIGVYSTWVSHVAEGIYGRHDVGHIVIDELAGLMVAATAVPFRWQQVLAAFLLFRLFDITKPWPVRWLDTHVGGGLGVVLDDIVAGVMACLVLHSLRLLWGGWW